MLGRKEKTMSTAPPVSDPISRNLLIDSLRQKLSDRAEDHSTCRANAENGIFCLGFCRFSSSELRQKLSWLVEKNPGATRSEIENLGDAWQLGRQEVLGVATACDVQSKEHDLCNGWDDFSDEDLKAFDRSLT
jgi:hypothetical protein